MFQHFFFQPTEKAFIYKVNHGRVPSNESDIFSVQSFKYHLRNRDYHLYTQI